MNKLLQIFVCICLVSLLGCGAEQDYTMQETPELMVEAQEALEPVIEIQDLAPLPPVPPISTIEATVTPEETVFYGPVLEKSVMQQRNIEFEYGEQRALLEKVK